MGSIVLGLAMLPSSAYTDDELIPVEITYQNFIDMVDAGDLDVTFSITVEDSASYYLYNMNTHTQTTFDSSSYYYSWGQNDGMSYEVITSDRMQFYWNQAFVQRRNSSSDGDLRIDVNIRYPFQFIFKDTEVGFFRFCNSGLAVSGTLNYKLIDSNNNVITQSNVTPVYQWQYWADTVNSDYLVDIQSFFNHYNWIPGSGTSYDTDSSSGIKSAITVADFGTISSNDKLVDHIVCTNLIYTYRDSSSSTGNANSFYAPVLFEIDPSFTVYVPKEYEDYVLEYLDLIAGPTDPGVQQRIDNLKDAMNGSVSDLEEAASDLHQTMPQLPTVNELPEEVTEGIGEATTVIFTPILGINIITILLTSVFIFTSLKLLLYGSGPS